MQRKLTLIKNDKAPEEVTRLKRVESEKKEQIVFSILRSMMDLTLEELYRIEDEVVKVACKRFNLIRNNTLSIPPGGTDE